MAKTGSLVPAFLFSYMLLAPIFGWLADRMSRWVLIGISVILWSCGQRHIPAWQPHLSAYCC